MMRIGILLVLLLAIGFCSLSSPPPVNAFANGYESQNYVATIQPTEDGAWTTADEWTAALPPTNLASNFVWREDWSVTQSGNIMQHFLIEFFNDNTNDSEDYYQICYDRLADGGTAPQVDDVKIEWKGHSISGLRVHKGNGSGWKEFHGYTKGVDIIGVDSLTTSPLNDTEHWVFEISINKSLPDFDINNSYYQPGIRVAVYDDSNAAAGIQAWPPTRPDAPSNWGQEVGTLSNLPEFFLILAVVALFAVAIMSVCLFRKR